MSIPAAFYDSSARKGLLFAFVGLGFVAASLWGIFSDLRRVFWYQPVQAVVTRFTAPDKAAADDLIDGRIEYSYTFHDGTYHGSYPAKGQQLGSFSRPLLDLPHNPNEEIAVAVNPAQPSISTADPRLSPSWIAMLIFTLPFAYMGLMTAWKGEDGLDNASFWPYAMLSAIGTVSILAAAVHLPWQPLACIGLSLPLAIPLLVKWLAHWLGLRHPNRGHGIYVRAAREDRTKFLFFTVFSIVWWCLIAWMIYQVVDSSSKCEVIQQKYQSAQGKIVVSGSKDASGFAGSRGRRIVYEFRVGETLYKGDRVTVVKEKITKAYLDKYPLNAAVTVYFDPTDPNQSVLERELPAGFGFLSVLLVIFVPLGFIVVWATFKAAGSQGMQVLRRPLSRRHRR